MKCKGAIKTVLLAIVVALVVLPLQPAQAAGPPCGQKCTVVSQNPAQYDGSLLLPPNTQSSDAGLVASASHCAGCRWVLAPACLRSVPDPELFCLHATAGCPDPGILTAIWLQRPTESAAHRVGEFCFQPGQALTPTALLPGVRDHFVKLLPQLRVTFQPDGRSLVNLPTLFDTHQPLNLGKPRFELGGHVIVLSATPQWGVDFGDGTVGTFDVPGGEYPNQDIAHPYLQPGDFAVAVTSTWSGEFTVDGLGPFTVTGPDIVQRQIIVVPVKEARAVLVAGNT